MTIKNTPDVMVEILEKCLERRCEDCRYDEVSGSRCMGTLLKDVKQVMEELMSVLENSGVIPTLEEAQEYLRGQGYPNAEFADNFLWGNRLERRAQFWECVKNNYDLPDFDRWQHFQNAIGGEITYREFMKIMEILYSHDIEIMEMKSGKNSIY